MGCLPLVGSLNVYIFHYFIASPHAMGCLPFVGSINVYVFHYFIASNTQDDLIAAVMDGDCEEILRLSHHPLFPLGVLRRVAVCCSVLQCSSELQFGAVWCSHGRRLRWDPRPLAPPPLYTRCVAACCSVLWCIAVCCSVLQHVAACCACCSVLQGVVSLHHPVSARGAISRHKHADFPHIWGGYD